MRPSERGKLFTGKIKYRINFYVFVYVWAYRIRRIIGLVTLI